MRGHTEPRKCRERQQLFGTSVPSALNPFTTSGHQSGQRRNTTFESTLSPRNAKTLISQKVRIIQRSLIPSLWLRLPSSSVSQQPCLHRRESGECPRAPTRPPITQHSRRSANRKHRAHTVTSSIASKPNLVYSAPCTTILNVTDTRAHWIKKQRTILLLVRRCRLLKETSAKKIRERSNTLL